MNVSFIVYGRPQPQGSTRAFMPKGYKRPVITSDNKNLKPWRQQVAWTAKEACRQMIARPAGVVFRAVCYFAPPAKMPKNRTVPSCKPDSDKLLRGLFDALTGIAYEDDAQIVNAQIMKVYGLPERAEISVSVAQVQDSVASSDVGM